MSSFFFFNDTATTEIYTLSLHDALPIYTRKIACAASWPVRSAMYTPPEKIGSTKVMASPTATKRSPTTGVDRKSTRLNSSHGYISYAVFCLKKKKTKQQQYARYKRKQYS